MPFEQGRKPIDTSECPDPLDKCARDSSSGEILYCGFHYDQVMATITDPEERALTHLNALHSQTGKFLPPEEIFTDRTPVEVLAQMHRLGECVHFGSLTELYGADDEPT